MEIFLQVYYTNLTKLFCWIVQYDGKKNHGLQKALQLAAFDSSSQFSTMDAVESPPTNFETNTFTNPCQEIASVCSGVVGYQEENPAAYKCCVLLLISLDIM
ncbi:unnamed protein product [Lathyrus sativus]|nr:unnamed protein product [Lathyrus sativus]